MKYLTNYRMQKAVELLHDENLTVKEIAVLVGYDSEVAFNQAFKRSYGFPPGVFRRASISTLLRNS
ncbi:helix-turn-helix transcriptional regulator [Iningainema sp. BLCCT55]|uniref:Helix-turn-helix transcriptional regulator n=2 Tax=Iningainema TaxID=1932705 RepID=A0A8J6XMK3_9CYAN|nr:helix-turn-helix transcriptional regulator [Iningainema tapete BLCC-T55]